VLRNSDNAGHARPAVIWERKRDETWRRAVVGQSSFDALWWLCLLILIGLFIAAAWCTCWLGKLPGETAHSRRHPQASAIAVCGWLGTLAGETFRPFRPEKRMYRGECIAPSVRKGNGANADGSWTAASLPESELNRIRACQIHQSTVVMPFLQAQDWQSPRQPPRRHWHKRSRRLNQQ
jgi:hypothetical protein